MLPAPLQTAAQGPHQSVGLVLSGGGAKGIAHIGVIKALEDNGIPIDYITGTSMGSIVGGLYVCGYTPEEMMELLLSPYFTSMSKGTYDPAYTYFFGSEPESPRMFSIPLGPTDPAVAKRFNPQSLIAPTPMAFGFMELFSAYTAQCHENFDNLFVPYRCVASNISKRRAMVHRSGNLGDCIRSSMSFPLVFQPVLMDGDMLVDGGLYCNFPVDVMVKDFNPSIMIGVDVSAPDTWPPNSFLDEISTLVDQPQSYEVPADRGMRMRIDLSEFGLLDFGDAKEIYQIGYDHAMSMMDSIKSRVKARVPAEEVARRRSRFKAATPPLRFGKVSVSGASERQNDYIASFFRPEKGCDTIGIDRARADFYRVLSSGKIKSINPQATLPSPEADIFDLSLETTIKSTFSAGIGGYITSSNNSFVYLSGGFSSLSYRSATARAEAWIGQSYMAGALSAIFDLPTSLPSAVSVSAVASRTRYNENEKYFFRDSEPTFLLNHEYFGKAAWSAELGRTGRLDIGAGAAHLDNSFFRNNDPESYRAGRDHERLSLGMVYAGTEFSTIDAVNFPTSGHYYHARVAGLTGRSHFTSSTDGTSTPTKGRLWGQLDWRSRNYFDLGRHFALGLESRAVLSTRPLFENYYGSVSMAPQFDPTPASNNVFDPGRRANSFAAIGLVPVWKLSSSLSMRLSANGFVPLRSFVMTDGGGVRYSSYLSRAEFFGELDVVYRLPFADVSAYCNYSSSTSRFNAGVSLGIYLKAPSFI